MTYETLTRKAWTLLVSAVFVTWWMATLPSVVPVPLGGLETLLMTPCYVPVDEDFAYDAWATWSERFRRFWGWATSLEFVEFERVPA